MSEPAKVWRAMLDGPERCWRFLPKEGSWCVVSEQGEQLMTGSVGYSSLSQAGFFLTRDEAKTSSLAMIRERLKVIDKDFAETLASHKSRLKATLAALESERE